MFIAQNSRFFENLLEHRFIFDLARCLVLQDPPRLLNISRSEVDAFGVDVVLSVAGKSRQVQMKTRSAAPPPTAYSISELLWQTPDACVVWMRYSPENLEPVSYHLFGLPLPAMEGFGIADRKGYRWVKMQHAQHKNLTIEALASRLFGMPPNTSLERVRGE